MKKRNLKSLSLNKKSISNLDSQQTKGGDVSIESGAMSCTNYSDFASCLTTICHSFLCSRECETFLCLPWENAN